MTKRTKKGFTPLEVNSTLRAKGKTTGKRLLTGFTLIELLVVIAIIGILASVVLASLGSARNKAKDARVQSDIQQARLLLETNYDGTKYPDLTGAAADCLTDSSATLGTALNTIKADIEGQAGTGAFTARITCASGSTQAKAYAIYGKLVTDTTKHFCMDSTGVTKTAAAADITNDTCI